MQSSNEIQQNQNGVEICLKESTNGCICLSSILEQPGDLNQKGIEQKLLE